MKSEEIVRRTREEETAVRGFKWSSVLAARMERNSQIFYNIVEMKLACFIGRTSVEGKKELQTTKLWTYAAGKVTTNSW